MAALDFDPRRPGSRRERRVFARLADQRRAPLPHRALVASFGRPVDVARFDFSLLDGARLEAHSVTVAEDPHFGNEYFLRAETLTAGLRWLPLLSGRFEFGSAVLVASQA